MTSPENQNTTITTTDYLFALQQNNLVYNHDFRYFSNQVVNGDKTFYGIPDGWQYNDPGTNGSINFDPETLQLIIKKSEGKSQKNLMTFSQALHEFPRWQQMLLGQTITARVVLNLEISGDISVILTDGINTQTATQSSEGDAEFNLRLNIHPAAESIYIKIECAVPFMTIKITKAFVNVGNVAIENLPCIVQGIIGERRQYIATQTPPAEELSLCNPPIELSSDYTRLNSVLQNRFGTGDNGNSMLIDMRGYFSRAWDNGAGVDTDNKNRTPPGNNDKIKGDMVSTIEQDAFLKHNHGLGFAIDKPYSPGTSGSSFNVIDPLGKDAFTKDSKDYQETRSKNIAELYTIKWA